MNPRAKPAWMRSLRGNRAPGRLYGQTHPGRRVAQRLFFPILGFGFSMTCCCGCMPVLHNWILSVGRLNLESDAANAALMTLAISVAGLVTIGIPAAVVASIQTLVLRDFLARRDTFAAYCPQCGYNRTGITADCPECGTPRPRSIDDWKR